MKNLKVKIQNQEIEINAKSILNNFINYTKVDTQSDENSQTLPSTKKQLDLIKILKKELQDLGIKKIKTTKTGYLYAVVPGTIKKKNNEQILGFLAHIDTAQDASGKNVKAQIHQNYDGKDIILNKKKNIILSTKTFPELKKYKNQTIITTNGTTLLGSDDKSGIAIIIETVKTLLNNKNLKYPTFKIAFSPDEEIGVGAHHFDIDKFSADIAYTIDGGEIGEMEWENFNASSAIITIKGINVHPGHAFGKMINSQLIANKIIEEINKTFPTPERTKDYEGFLYLYATNGNTEKTTLKYLIRDHSKKEFNLKKKKLKQIIKEIQKQNKKAKIDLEIKDQYFNMAEKIKPVKYIVNNLKQAILNSNIKPIEKPIRGGTDGSILSYKGLPTPNIFTGGHNFHSIYEYIPLESMQKSTEVVLRIILEESNANKKSQKTK